MATCESVVRSWGNSAGVIIPKSVLEKENIEVGDRVEFLLRRTKSKPGDTFGVLRGKLKMSGQEAKDMLRKELWGIE